MAKRALKKRIPRKWIPRGFHSITPRLVARNPKRLVEFLQEAFDATGEYSAEHPAEMHIGDSIVLVSGVGPRRANPSFLYLYVKDVDAVYERALGAGAESLEAPSEMPYGDRRAMIKDPAGNDWQVATHRRIVRRPSSS
jgi:PhnB protein